MALHLRIEENTIYLKGRLLCKEAYQIKPIIEQSIRNTEDLKINISELDDMDLSGAMVLRDLAKKEVNKTFNIIRGENQKILGPLKVIDLAA